MTPTHTAKKPEPPAGIRNLLVPLDGSELAESALPPAIALARAFGATIHLLHLIEQDAPGAVHGRQRHLSESGPACDYLAELALRIPEGISVNRHVHTSAVRDVARSIVDHTRELEGDLVVMCAHGQGGLRDMLAGNIAQQVIARGGTPVFFLPAGISRGAPAGAGYACKKILLPLDGDPAHERCADTAIQFARAFQAGLHLVTVISTTSTLTGERAAAGRLLPGSAAALLEMEADAAADNLLEHTRQISALGLAVESTVARGDPAEELAAETARWGADLIVLGTHGKAGADAFWARSVTARTLGRIAIPALLVPVHRPG